MSSGLINENHTPPVVGKLLPPMAVSLPVETNSTAPQSDWRGPRFEFLTSTLSSTLLHIILLIALVLWATHPKANSTRSTITVSVSIDDTPNQDLRNLSTETQQVIIQPAELAIGPRTVDSIQLPEQPAVQIQLSEPPLLPSEVVQPTPKTPGTGASGGTAPQLSGLDGKGRKNRRAQGKTVGATDESEAAVERALAWFAAHQRKDGSWRFDHTDGACDGTCGNPGNHPSTTASTALVLLCYYGAGYTHMDGPYHDTINRGLYYLGGRMLVTQNGGDLQEGTMYAQGISTITICEATALTEDRTLRGYGERAVDFILYAQDRRGGGWRYIPGEPGDTTVTGWQLMALKSAQMAGITVPSTAFQDAERYLDSVQSNAGANYGYKDRQPQNSTTAVGLLCRMYLGWNREHPGLVAGVKKLDDWGPSKTDLYYNYYATQVMMHYGGQPWERWNGKQRDYLIETQSKVGHQAGSWHFADKHSDRGGRLLNTALATLTLEVYYRYAPLYQTRAAESGY